MINITPNRGLALLLVVLIVFSLIMVFVSYQGQRVTNGVRAYIYGEGQWTKAQKQATNALYKYLYTGNPDYYDLFHESLTVIDGDQIGREAALSDNRDFELARQGFLQGKNHPEDVDDMIWILKYYHLMPDFQAAVDIWVQGESRIEDKRVLAERIFERHTTDTLDQELIDRFSEELMALDLDLTRLEVEFSDSMSRAARQAETLVFWVTVLTSTILIFAVGFMAFIYIQKTRSSNREIKRSEFRLRNVLENSVDLIYQHNLREGGYDFVSSSSYEILGIEPETLKEAGPEYLINRIHPDDRVRMNKELQRLEGRDIDEFTIGDSEFRVQKPNGEYVWVQNRRTLIRDSSGEIAAVVGNVRDITPLKEQVGQINQSLMEKKLLLSEIHHRVKNNLAVISSLIEAQKMEMDELQTDHLNELQGRIKSIALIHDKLYKTENLSEVELSQYMQELTEIIANTYRSDGRKIELEYDLEPIKSNIVKAVPVGMICNELINNAFKHAFDEAQNGCLRLKLGVNNETVELIIEDDAGKLPQNFTVDGHDSLGMTLVKTLTSQLEGELYTSVEKGEFTRFNVRFKL